MFGFEPFFPNFRTVGQPAVIQKTGLWEASLRCPAQVLPARKLSLNAEHGAAAISVRRPENDLVPPESGLSLGVLGAGKLTHLDCLIGSNRACEMHQTQTFVHLTLDCCSSPTTIRLP